MDLIDTNWMAQVELGIRITLAVFLGAVIGLERELAHRPAGLRTHAILAGASAMLVGLGDAMLAHFVSVSSRDLLQVDPMRIVQAVVTGVSFLGAGTIFRDGNTATIEGLTTAASLLLVAAIGIAVATAQVVLAVYVTGLTLVLLRVLRKLAPE